MVILMYAPAVLSIIGPKRTTPGGCCMTSLLPSGNSTATALCEVVMPYLMLGSGGRAGYEGQGGEVLRCAGDAGLIGQLAEPCIQPWIADTDHSLHWLATHAKQATTAAGECVPHVLSAINLVCWLQRSER